MRPVTAMVVVAPGFSGTFAAKVPVVSLVGTVVAATPATMIVVRSTFV